MRYTEFKQALFDCVNAVFTSLETPPTGVVWAPQVNPRLPKPYVTLYPINPSIADKGQDQTQFNRDGDYVVSGQRKSIVSINAYGLGGLDILHDFQSAIFDPDVVIAFALAGIAVLDVTNLRDLSILVDTAYETRGQIDCTFGWVAERVVPTVPIEEVFINDVEISI